MPPASTRMPPRLVVTCARGSSGHAATFAKYIFEQKPGIPVLSFTPSLTSPLAGDEGDPGALPAAPGQAVAADWSAPVPQLAGAQSLYSIGRGRDLAIAREVALNFKEAACPHAVAAARGLDPDCPRWLTKVTRTL